LKSSRMEPNEDHSLILRPSHELVAPQIGANRILGEMVESSLAVAKDVFPEKIDLDALVGEAKRIQRREGITPEAFRLFHQAATGGHSEAQYLLGECYELGIGVVSDFDESDRWFSLAAANGNAEAQCKVAEFYRDGLAGVRDYVTAAQWYYKAAIQGNAEAQFELGLYFSGGRRERSLGSCPDRPFMKEYFDEQVVVALKNVFLGEKVPFEVLNAIANEIIIPANRKITATLLRKLVRMRDELGSASSPIHDCIRESIVRFGRSAVSWFRKAAEQGHADAQRNLALCYQNGDGIEVDLVQAFAWLQLAAVQKEELARLMIEQSGFVISADKEAEQARREAAVIASSMSGLELETAQDLYRNFRELYSEKH
jgi:TPR repeat protein